MSEKNCNQLQLFALKLKYQRKQKELSKKDIANLVGISKKKQAKYEKGIKFPCLDYLFKLSLIGFELGEMGISDMFSNSNETTIIDLYRKSSPKSKQKILQILLNDLFQEQKVLSNNNSAAIVGKQAITTKKSKIIKTVIYLET